MPLAYEPADIRYIAYIDEAGDPGLTKVRPLQPEGATEWLSIGALLIKAECEQDTVSWVQSIRQSIELNRGPDIHFRNLNPYRKLRVCQEVAALPVKCFVLLSNKKNMHLHRNERVENARPSTQEWFYNWCIKLLLERISDFVEYNSVRRYGEPKHVQLIFSERGGVRYAQTSEYHELVRSQARSKTTLLTKRMAKWRVLHPASSLVVPHTQNAGVQLADTVASSFYQAANASASGWNTKFAETLEPVIPAECGQCADYGVTLQPHWNIAKLTKDQQKIFRFYGYPLPE
jgi:uncharacterized protein DUF3800